MPVQLTQAQAVQYGAQIVAADNQLNALVQQLQAGGWTIIGGDLQPAFAGPRPMTLSQAMGIQQQINGYQSFINSTEMYLRGNGDWIYNNGTVVQARPRGPGGELLNPAQRPNRPIPVGPATPGGGVIYPGATGGMDMISFLNLTSQITESILGLPAGSLPSSPPLPIDQIGMQIIQRPPLLSTPAGPPLGTPGGLADIITTYYPQGFNPPPPNALNTIFGPPSNNGVNGNPGTPHSLCPLDCLKGANTLDNLGEFSVNLGGNFHTRSTKKVM